MAYQLEGKLVVGISSRALFHLEEENRLFQRAGLEEYAKYQIEHEEDILLPGTGFPIIKALLKLNDFVENKIKIEVIVMSRNSADTSLRIFKSIEHYKLPITRAVWSGGESLARYLKTFKIDLFLSTNEEDVEKAINANIAAGMLYPTTQVDADQDLSQLRIAFDGDAVLFSADSELVYQQEGLDAFIQHEVDLVNQVMQEGPFAKFLMSLSSIQQCFDAKHMPIRTALVTARNAPAHERVIKTLRAWNVRIDEAFFLGGIEKSEVLKAFGAHIFFDDQDVHLGPASTYVPSARVPIATKK